MRLELGRVERYERGYWVVRLPDGQDAYVGGTAAGTGGWHPGALVRVVLEPQSFFNTLAHWRPYRDGD